MARQNNTRLLITVAVGITAIALGLATQHLWWSTIAGFVTGNEPKSDSDADKHSVNTPKLELLELSAQARKNLGLVVQPVQLQDYWRTLLIPGEIMDRPGISDRGVTSPAVGVVAQVHAFPGDTVRVGQALFTLRLFSEYLQNTQSELFKATNEVRLVSEQVTRLQGLADTGAIPEARVIELDNQLRRQEALILAYRQDLLARGLTPEQVAEVTEGRFVSTIEVVAPPAVDRRTADALLDPNPNPIRLVSSQEDELIYEVQELAVELGQQVQAGQLLAKLSNHQSLFVVGHAFKQEAPYLEQAAQDRRPVELEFVDDDAERWPAVDRVFEIRHLSNSIDPVSRTFDFFIPLDNQSRGYTKEGETFLVWRYRPGQRTRLHVPVEQFANVFVLPAAGVARDGAETFVFRQNGDLFDRRAVHVIYEDRQVAVIENDGSISPGMYLAHNGAASLNRVLAAQASSGEEPGVHVHADGTVHAAH